MPIAIITVGASRIGASHIGESQVAAILPNIIADIGTETLVTTTIRAIGMVLNEVLILVATEVAIIIPADLGLSDSAVVQISDTTIRAIGMVLNEALILVATKVTVIILVDLDRRDMVVAQISDTTIRASAMVLSKASILGANVAVRRVEWDRRRLRHRSDCLRYWTQTKMVRLARTNF